MDIDPGVVDIDAPVMRPAHFSSGMKKLINFLISLMKDGDNNRDD